MEAVNRAVLGLLFILCYSLLSLEVAVQETIVGYDILLQFSGDGIIFMCLLCRCCHGDDIASCDARLFGLEGGLCSGIACDSVNTHIKKL